LKGTEWDGYSISIIDDANDVAADDNEFVILNTEDKTLEIHIDDGVSTLDDILGAINDDSYVSQYFKADAFGDADGTTVITLANSEYNTDDRTTTGGLVDAGTLIINLETDENGVVKTTANDLIAFFDDPSQFITDTNRANAVLAELQARGISVSNAEGSD